MGRRLLYENSYYMRHREKALAASRARYKIIRESRPPRPPKIVIAKVRKDLSLNGIVSRLEDKSIKDENTGCIDWSGARINGYGVIVIDGKNRLIHRAIWELNNGKIAAGMQICHHCDNPSCWNIDHLFIGTSKDNVADMMSKGRNAKGEKNGNARLTENQVIAIRKLLENFQDLYAMFDLLASAIGITKGYLVRIVNGDYWKDIKISKDISCQPEKEPSDFKDKIFNMGK